MFEKSHPHHGRRLGGAGLLLGLKSMSTRTPLWLVVAVLACVALTQAADAQTLATPRLTWVVEPGAESLVVAKADAVEPLVAALPGAAYALGCEAGGWRKLAALALDPAAPNAAAISTLGFITADRAGTIRSWSNPTCTQSGVARWEVEPGERVVSIAWDGGLLVLVGTAGGRLLALSAQDGKRLWATELGGKADAPAVVEAGAVFAATKSRSLLRIDAANGGVRWRAELPGTVIHAPVLVAQEAVAVVTWDGQLTLVNALTGKVRWTQALGARAAAAPVAVGDAVVAIAEDGAARCFGLDGQLRWSVTDVAQGPVAHVIKTSVSMADALVVVSRTLVTLNPGTGQRLTSYPGDVLEALRRRFADAMIEGEKTYSEGEKHAIIAREAFDIAGSPSGPTHVQGGRLIFGSDEGWLYVFDLKTLRPLWRYHAGQATTGPLLSGRERLVTAVGDDLYALDERSGETKWRRGLGAPVVALAGGEKIGALAGERLHGIDWDGALAFSVRGHFRSLVGALDPAASFWLADDGEGALRVVLASGELPDARLAVGGDLVGVVPVAERTFAAATREGRVFGVTAVAAPRVGLERTWELQYGERLSELRALAGRLFLRGERGSLACLDPATGRVVFELAPAEQTLLASDGAHAVVMVAGELKVYEIESKNLVWTRKLAAPPVGADLKDGLLSWLDQRGMCYRVALASKQEYDRANLGTSLVRALPLMGGYAVITSAAEVGYAELAHGMPGVGLQR